MWHRENFKSRAPGRVYYSKMTSPQRSARAEAAFKTSWILRSLVAFAALAFAFIAIARSFGWLSIAQLQPYTDQSLQDLAILLVSYAVLAIVRQKNRPWYFDVVVFCVSFGLWIWAVLSPENDPADQVSRTTFAVLFAVGAGIFAPIWKQDKWIWQR